MPRFPSLPYIDSPSGKYSHCLTLRVDGISFPERQRQQTIRRRSNMTTLMRWRSLPARGLSGGQREKRWHQTRCDGAVSLAAAVALPEGGKTAVGRALCVSAVSSMYHAMYVSSNEEPNPAVAFLPPKPGIMRRLTVTSPARTAHDAKREPSRRNGTTEKSPGVSLPDRYRYTPRSRAATSLRSIRRVGEPQVSIAPKHRIRYLARHL